MQIAAARHGLPGIDEEVEEDLFHLAAIHIHRPGIL
jgi:hypothetical protein